MYYDIIGCDCWWWITRTRERW